jgi:hypothetical protein
MNRTQLYDLSDALQIPLRIDGRDISSPTDAKPKKLKFGELVLPAPYKVISSAGPFSGVALVVHVVGKLGLFACVENIPADFTVFVLDLAKLPDDGVGILEAHKPNDMSGAMAAVEAAIVATFRRRGKNPWQPVHIVLSQQQPSE